MKRRIPLAMSVVLAVALVACSNDDAAPEPSPTSTMSSPTPTPTPSPTPTPTPTPTTTVAPPPTPSPTPTPTPTPKPTPKPAGKFAEPKVPPIPSPKLDPLTGGTFNPNPVIAVKLDNTSAGRPQFGLSQADVVYVQQVEGGLTRLVALFHTVFPKEVGPVRSVRSTDSELLTTYGRPVLMYSGGAGGPLAMLAQARAIVDGSRYAATWRSSAKRAPYNLHVNLQQLRQALAKTKLPVQSPGFNFKANDPSINTRPVVRDIDVRMNAGRTRFVYHRGGNYRVYLSGAPAYAGNGDPIHTHNVLVQHVLDRPDGTVDTNGQPSLLSKTLGRGTFELYRNGRKIAGTWVRLKPADRTLYRDLKGKPVHFRPGKTWVMLVPQSGSVVSSR